MLDWMAREAESRVLAAEVEDGPDLMLVLELVLLRSGKRVGRTVSGEDPYVDWHFVSDPLPAQMPLRKHLR